jgi:hypothetical protein
MAIPHIQIVIGSAREQRRGPAIARWFADIATMRDDITSELLDLAEFELPFLSGATPPMNPESRDGMALGWAAKVAEGVLPSVLALLGRRTWALPTPLERRLPRIAIEAPVEPARSVGGA